MPCHHAWFAQQFRGCLGSEFTGLIAISGIHELRRRNTSSRRNDALLRGSMCTRDLLYEGRGAAERGQFSIARGFRTAVRQTAVSNCKKVVYMTKRTLYA